MLSSKAFNLHVYHSFFKFLVKKKKLNTLYNYAKLALITCLN